MEKTVLMQINIFLIINALLIIKPTVNSLFLVQFGVETLPKAYLVVAGFALVISGLYTRILSSGNLLKILTITYASSVLVLISLGILLGFQVVESWALWFFYVWVAMFALVCTSQFWIFCNLVFNVRQAKRLFGFIGSGAIAGGILGGYLTTALAPVIGTEKLPFLAAFLLLLCIPITRRVWRQERRRGTIQVTPGAKKTDDATYPFRIIRKSRHLALLTAIVGISVLVAKLVDFQFSAMAAASIPNPDKLTAFFGFWFSTMNIVSLLIQLFATRHVVGVFGVGTSLLFLPLGILGGAVAAILSPKLWSVVLMKIFDGSLKQSVNKAGIELMAVPIPDDIRTRTKSFIDVIIDSVATGFSGLILYFVVKGLDLDHRVVSVIVVVLVGIWIWLALQLRKEYLHTFRDRLTGVTKKRTDREFNLQNESVLIGLRRVLAKGEEKQVLYILNRVRSLKDNRLVNSYRQLLKHASPKIRAAALHNVYYLKRSSLADEIRPMLSDTDPTVRVYAAEYLFAHSEEDHITEIRKYVQSPDDLVRWAAVAGLSRETRDNPLLQKKYGLPALINAMEEEWKVATGEKRVEISRYLFDAIGFGNLQDWLHLLEVSLYDSEPGVVTAAISGSGKSLNPQFLPVLLDKLTERDQEEHARNALLNYGPRITGWFHRYLDHNLIATVILRKVPTVLEHIGTQESLELLLDLLDDNDRVTRNEALRGLNHLRNEFPFLKFNRKAIIDRILYESHLYRDTLSALHTQNLIVGENLSEVEKAREDEIRKARTSLIQLLERRLDNSLERMFRFLGLRYSPEDIYPIYLGLNSKLPDARDNALEFLDNILEPGLKRILIPIVETAMADSISDEVLRKLHIQVPSEFECMKMLLSTHDKRIFLSTIYLISQLDDPRYIEILSPLSSIGNDRMRARISNAIENLRHAAATNSEQD